MLLECLVSLAGDRARRAGADRRRPQPGRRRSRRWPRPPPSELGHGLRPQGRELRLRRHRQRRPRGRARARARRRARQRRHRVHPARAGSTCMRARTDPGPPGRRRRRAACCTRTACSSTPASTSRASTAASRHRFNHGPGDLPEALAAVPLPRDRRAAADPPRDARARSASTTSRFGLAHEDIDYCLRVFEAGLECIYEPAAVAVHHESLFRGKRCKRRSRTMQQALDRAPAGEARRDRHDRLDPGDPVSALPRTLFVGLGASGRRAGTAPRCPPPRSAPTGSASAATPPELRFVTGDTGRVRALEDLFGYDVVVAPAAARRASGSR